MCRAPQLCLQQIWFTLCRYDKHEAFDEEEASVRFISSGKALFLLSELKIIAPSTRETCRLFNSMF